MKKIEIATTWQVPGLAAQACQVELERYDGIDQVLKAVKSGGLFLLLAAATVPIPIVHIFAPALFVALAIFMIARSLSLYEIASAASGICGKCQGQVRAELGSVKPSYPLWTICPACRERLRVLAPVQGSGASGEKL